MTRVLLMTQEIHPIPPVKGAAVEYWIYAVSKRLENYQPFIVSPPHPFRPDWEREGDVQFQRIGIGRLYTRLFRKLTRLDPYGYVDRVAHYARREKIGLIHIQNAPKLVAPLRAKVPGAKIILHMQNDMDVSGLPELDGLAGCSEYILDRCREQGVKARVIQSLPNGVDPALFVPWWQKPEEKERLRATFKMDGKKVILYVGRISQEKGVDLLVEAFRHLDRERYVLALLGEWPQGDPATSQRVAFAQEVERRLEGLPVIRLGTVEPEEVPRFHPLADLLVVPSRFEEPFSMAAIEAMASGIPVLALKRGGMVEYMEDGRNAFLLDPSTTDGPALADAIERVLGDQETLRRVTHNARRLVEHRFSWKEVAAATEAYYDAVMGWEGEQPSVS
ncbi:MAG: glycosyltransferase [Magnetococcales bacterium]|nr:glycosyltransferase [Magnetococcales bacterium]